MSNIDSVDLEEVERRLAFVMSELREIERDTFRIVRKATHGGPGVEMARWAEGRFSAFLQTARDAVWTARCTVGLVPDNKDES